MAERGHRALFNIIPTHLNTPTINKYIPESFSLTFFFSHIYKYIPEVFQCDIIEGQRCLLRHGRAGRRALFRRCSQGGLFQVVQRGLEQLQLTVYGRSGRVK